MEAKGILVITRYLCEIPADHKLRNYTAGARLFIQQIDALVYELYGLTEEEVAVVEGR